MKIGTIGTGFIVETFLEGVAMNEGVEVSCMYSRREETALPLAKKFNIGTIYTDINKLYADSTINFIYVASPNSIHFQQAHDALMAGKNVICEKPFTSTTKELAILRDLAKEKNLFLFEAITTIHLPNYKRIKEKVKEIGTIRMIECNFSKYSSRYDDFLAGNEPNIFNPDFSGGALTDLNIYNIHFVMNMFGIPKTAIYVPNIQENGIDSSGVAVFTYDGFIASMVAAKESTAISHAYIQGEKGSIYMHGSSGGCHDVEYVIDGTSQKYSEHPTDNNLYFEIVEFKKIFDAKDYQECYRLLDYSYDVYTIIEKIRKEANVIFAADKECA